MKHHTPEAIREALRILVAQCAEMKAPILVSFMLPDRGTETLSVGTEEHAAKFAANVLDAFAQRTTCKHPECAAAELVAMLNDRSKEPKYEQRTLNDEQGQ